MLMFSPFHLLLDRLRECTDDEKLLCHDDSAKINFIILPMLNPNDLLWLKTLPIKTRPVKTSFKNAGKFS